MYGAQLADGRRAGRTGGVHAPRPGAPRLTLLVGARDDPRTASWATAAPRPIFVIGGSHRLIDERAGASSTSWPIAPPAAWLITVGARRPRRGRVVRGDADAVQADYSPSAPEAARRCRTPRTVPPRRRGRRARAGARSGELLVPCATCAVDDRQVELPRGGRRVLASCSLPACSILPVRPGGDHVGHRLSLRPGRASRGRTYSTTLDRAGQRRSCAGAGRRRAARRQRRARAVTSARAALLLAAGRLARCGGADRAPAPPRRR